MDEFGESDLTAARNLLPAQLAATNLSRAKLTEPLGSFEGLNSVEGLSQNSSKIFIILIGAVVYTFLTMVTTRDVQLITNVNSIKLPVIGTEMPIIGFYIATPLIHFFRQVIGVPIVGKEVLTSVPMTIRTGWKLLPGTTTFSSSGPSGTGDTVDIFDQSYNRIRSTSLSVISSFVRS